MPSKIIKGLKEAVRYLRKRNMTKEIVTNEIRLHLTQGTEGLFYGTSPDVSGLFLAYQTEYEVIEAVPKAMQQLDELRKDLS